MALASLILDVEDVFQFHLNGLGPENRARGGLEELRVHANLSAGPQERPAQNRVDASLRGDFSIDALVAWSSVCPRSWSARPATECPPASSTPRREG